MTQYSLWIMIDMEKAHNMMLLLCAFEQLLGLKTISIRVKHSLAAQDQYTELRSKSRNVSKEAFVHTYTL